MSGIKKGARVHVEFDGEVEGVTPKALVLLQHGWCVPIFACSVIVPPVKVGDTVTADNVGQLPNGSIVARPGETPIWTWDDNWFQWDVAAPSNRDVALGATVLRIGDAS